MLSLIDARPLKEGDGKGADRGVDGLLYFYDYTGAKPHSVRTDSTSSLEFSPTKEKSRGRGGTRWNASWEAIFSLTCCWEFRAAPEQTALTTGKFFPRLSHLSR